MPNRRCYGWIVALLLIFCVIFMVFSSAYAAQFSASDFTPSTNIRLNSWLYPALEKLAANNLIITHLWGTRPFTQNEIVDLLAEAQLRLEALQGEGKTFTPVIRSIIEEIAATTKGYGLEDTPYFQTFQNPELQFIYREGKKSFSPGINASQFSLVYNNEGIKPAEGGNGYLRFEVEGGIGPFSLYLQPLLSLEGDTTSAVLHQGYVKLGLTGLEFEVGKESLWWGQGYHGGLFLTNNADPLKLIRVTNPSPTILPWIFKYFGPFRFDFFVSRLEEERVVPEPIFTGLRFNFKPQPVIELGLTRTIMMLGEGRPGFTLKRLADILFGDNKERDEDLSNSIAGLDVRFTLPFLQIYGEYGGEDEAGGFVSEPAYLVGFYLPDIGKNVNFRMEFADITNRSWYRHGVYRSGYTYRGRVLGHHVGRGGRDLFFELGLLPGSSLNGKINFDYEERGVNIRPVTEKHFQIGTEWEWRGLRYQIGKTLTNWSTRLRVAYDRIENADFIAGNGQNNFLVDFGIRWNR